MPAWRNISLWMDQLDEPLLARPALERDLDVDVAIIGAGYTGLWTAYYLKRQAPGLDIAIVEAQTAGFGASGRNGGWLMGNILGEDRLLANLPAEQRRAAYELLHGIPDEVEIVLEREGIDCDYRKGGALYCAARYPEQEASLREYLDKLYQQGLSEREYRWLSPEQLAQQIRIAKPYGGIFAPHVATIHPAKLVRGLARTVERMGVRIYENSPVTHWQSGSLRTAKASVRTRWVVPAVEGYAATLPGLGRYQLIRAFRTATGLTPHAYLINAKVNRGRQLLNQGQALAQVAYQLGFADQSHFQRVFKAHVGVTPGQYRGGSSPAQ